MVLIFIVCTFVALLDMINALIPGSGISLVAPQVILVVLGTVSIVKLFNIIQSAEKTGK